MRGQAPPPKKPDAPTASDTESTGEHLPEPTPSDDNAIVQRNTLVSVLGTLAKLAAPIYLALATRLYGIEVFGIFATAQVFAEMGMSFLTAGLNDAALMHAGVNQANHEATLRRNRALGTSFFWVSLLSLCTLLPASMAAPWLLRPFFDYADILGEALQWMAVGIPAFGLGRMMVAATVGHNDMRYDAIVNGVARPLGLLVFAALGYFIVPDIRGLAMGWACAQIASLLVAWHGFRQYARPQELWAAIRAEGPDPQVIRFAIPQSLSVTFQRFAAGMDLLMLGALGVSPAITGIYAVGMQVADNAVNTIRFIFVNVFNPWVPTYIRSQKSDDLSRLWTTLSRRSSFATTMLAIAIIAFETEIMGLFVPDYTTMPLTFTLLIAAPWVLGLGGLSGSIIVLSGHSRLNLLNALAVALLNFLLNLWLIPRHGALGAALGTTIGMATLVGLQFFESRRFVGVDLSFRSLQATLILCTSMLGAALCLRLIGPNALALRALACLGMVGVLWLVQRAVSTHHQTPNAPTPDGDNT